MPQASTKTKFNSKSFQLGFVLAALLFSGLLTWWLLHRADQSMRDELLQQTRVVAQILDLERFKKLTGSDKDLDSPDYLFIKAQFASIKNNNPLCRFVYLLGQKPDGGVYFFVDNEPVGSENESPAGQ